MKKDKKPERSRLTDSVHHMTFVSEGTMAAFPTCFPGITIPLKGDESFITAMDITDDASVYAGTGGRAAHLLVGMFHGVTGMVLDMGEVEDCTETAAICCGDMTFAAFCNGKKGGRIVTRKLQQVPFDLLQEWTIPKPEFEYIDLPFDGEKMVHAVRTLDRTKAVGITEKRLFELDFDSCELKVFDEVPGKGRIALGSEGNVFGIDEADTLWKWDVVKQELTHNAVQLPFETKGIETFYWARNPVNGTLYTADADANLYAFTEKDGFSKALVQLDHKPVKPMAVTNDGRVYGTNGEGIARIFCFRPEQKSITDVGVAVSTLQIRRYAYDFGDAVTGRDGEIVFGENDDLGHIWLYFPPIN